MESRTAGLIIHTAPEATDRRIVAFVDIGTNAIRLLIVRVVPGHLHTVITEQREPTRLGEGEFPGRRLQPDPMDRAVLVCKNFVHLARSHGAEEIVAVATSATREALNADEFLLRLRLEADLHVRVISGREEARLIHAGLTSFIHLGHRKAVFLDIGGGSTEVIVGGQRQYEFLDTIGLGAVRLTSLLLPSTDAGPISPKRYKKLKQHARHAAVHTVDKVNRLHSDLMVGTAGTIRNLVAIANAYRRRTTPEDPNILTHDELQRIAAMLCALPVKERRKVSGLNPDRADIIVSGAAILDVLMEDLGFDQMYVVPVGGLREGLLMDYLAQNSHDLHWLSVRERSVLHLGRACHFDEPHARAVERLALELFDTAGKAGLHSHGERERELLAHAALLHDIGSFLSYGNHHVHSYYLIHNADLLGFHQAELTVMALAALFHRRSLPSTEQPDYATLHKEDRNVVKFLSLILRLTESLERSHQNIVKHVRIEPSSDKELRLTIQVSGDPQLELWGLRSRQKAIRKTLGRRLVVSVDRAQPSAPDSIPSEIYDKTSKRPAEFGSVNTLP
ncbi:MAG: Ppx/GppA phosphatase family protein [Thermoleophilia bacterium]